GPAMEKDQVIPGEIRGLLHKNLLDLGGDAAPFTAFLYRIKVAPICRDAHQGWIEVANPEHHTRVFDFFAHVFFIPLSSNYFCLLYVFIYIMNEFTNKIFRLLTPIIFTQLLIT